MKQFSRIVFWQNIVSPHMVPLIIELAKDSTRDVILVVPQELRTERVELGWTVPDCSPAQLIVNPTKKEVKKIIKDRSKETCHVYGGMRGCSFVWDAFKISRSVETFRVIISEPYRWQGVKGGFRILRGQFDAWYYGKYINCIFAIGSLAVQWFNISGFSEDKIVEFAYFTDYPETEPNQESPDDVYKIVFVGQCIKRKGIDLLLRALSNLKDMNWQLEVIGEGKERVSLQLLTRKLGLSTKIDFLGSKPNSEVTRHLQCIDLLVLPSRWDGWGAVVNEALCRGVPVVCSNNCGAADLVLASGVGGVFSSGSFDSLGQCLQEQILRGRLPEDKIMHLREWAESINAVSAAKYFSMVVDAYSTQSEVPIVPWKKTIDR